MPLPPPAMPESASAAFRSERNRIKVVVESVHGVRLALTMSRRCLPCWLGLSRLALASNQIHVVDAHLQRRALRAVALGVGFERDLAADDNMCALDEVRRQSALGTFAEQGAVDPLRTLVVAVAGIVGDDERANGSAAGGISDLGITPEAAGKGEYVHFLLALLSDSVLPVARPFVFAQV